MCMSFPPTYLLKKGAIKASFISESLVEGKVLDSSRLPQVIVESPAGPPPPILSLMLFVSHPWHLVDPLKAAFKYQLHWVLLKYFINGHLSHQE